MDGQGERDRFDPDPFHAELVAEGERLLAEVNAGW